jgi:hypothetical protein
MKRLQRPMRGAPTIALSAIVASLMLAAAAVADDIPRPPGAIEHRGYELVSLPDKGGHQVHVVNLPRTGGDRVLYDVFGGATGAVNGLTPIFRATRTTSGWRSDSILPPRAELIRLNYVISATTPDLSRAVVSMFDGSIGSTDDSPDEALGLLGPDGAQTLLHVFPVFENGGAGVAAVASEDLSHVYADVAGSGDPGLDPSQQPGTSDVYDFASGTPVLVSRMPGSGVAPLCGVQNPTDPSLAQGFASSADSAIQHWASDDGARVFFVTAGDDPTCAAPLELYVRDVAARTTTPISGPPVGADPDNGVDRFLSASADGSRVFYRTATSLVAADDADADASDLDIYRWTAADGNRCLTCLAPHAQVSTFAFPGNVNAVASQDGSHVYFTSPNQLADAPAAADPGALNLYEWRSGQATLHFIAQVNGIAARSLDGGELTPDGEVLLFTSNQPGLDALSGASNGGFMQYYRYDDRNGAIACLSCPASGTPTVDVSGQLTEVGSTALRADSRAVTDDGRTAFFSTVDPLVPEDVNGDVDIYEWHDGTVGLITDGTTHHPEGARPQIVGNTPDGRDFYFFDVARLTSDAADDAKKLYDARIDGGFPPAPPPPPPCAGDGCHQPPSSAPELPDPFSASLVDDGNVVPGSLTIAPIGRRQLRSFAATGLLSLAVRVSGAGRVAASAQAMLRGRTTTVARAASAVRAAGRAVLRLRLSAAARRQLARTGRLRLVLVASFSEAPGSKRLTLVLRRERRSR